MNTISGNSALSSLPSRNMGLSGRATYGYDDRYFAEFNFGYNGSEKFAENNRFGFFHLQDWAGLSQMNLFLAI